MYKRQPEDCLQKREPIGNLLAYLQGTFDTLIEAQAIAYGLSKPAQRRTINISDCGVRTTDFMIRADDDDQQYQQMVAAGEAAAYLYLANYNPPLIKPVWPFALYIDRTRRRIRKWYAQRRRDKIQTR